MNRKRREEGGKVLLDISKYVATSVAISELFTKGGVNWIAVVIGCTLALLLYFVGLRIIPPDKEA